MRILFDHGTPSGIAGSLSGHEVTEARERGWDRISNGDLLRAAEAVGPFLKSLLGAFGAASAATRGIAQPVHGPRQMRRLQRCGEASK